jgi:hypothetical protein
LHFRQRYGFQNQHSRVYKLYCSSVKGQGYASRPSKELSKVTLSPAEVLGQETGKLRTPEQLHRIFYAMRFLRRLDRLGYAHFRRWKLYGEEALARQPAVMRAPW